jgi:prephenate dehydratase
MDTMGDRIKVAFQGEPGAFSEKAAHRLLGADIETLPRQTFEDIFEAVVAGDADCCVAPIENSLAGSIHRNYDLLLESKLIIAAETNLRIAHSLIAPPDVPFEQIRRVYSHPVALAQCTRLFKEHGFMEPAPTHDTAGAVRLVMERGRNDEAAIASADAAKIYGARVLKDNVEDNSQNYTRFLLLAPPGRIPAKPARRWKTSIVFRMPNKPGALFRALGAFALFEIDLARIESRPVEGRPWEYSFYLDLIGQQDEPDVAHALKNLVQMADMVKVLGSYPTDW